jgi:hypothetical protein
MTVISVLLVLITLAMPLAFLNAQNRQLAPLMFLSCAVHCIAVFTQHEILKTVTADAHLYYYDLEGYTGRPIAFGTSFVVYLTQFLKNSFQLEFIDIMYIYGMTGAAAILLLMRWIYLNMAGSVKWIGCFLCFLPSLHFWTSSIGKDAPMALALVLLVLSFSNIKNSLLPFVVGSLICLAIRPHIFVILLAAYVAARVLRSSSFGLRILAVVLAIAFIPLARIIMQNFIGLDILSSTDTIALFSERQNYFSNTTDDGVIYIDNLFLRVIYFSFSPFFYDANSALSLVSSFENLIILLILLRLSSTFWKIDITKKAFATFLIFLVLLLFLFNGLGGYNVGLALRQKVMLYPALIVVFLLGEVGRAASKWDRRHRLKPARKLSHYPIGQIG